MTLIIFSSCAFRVFGFLGAANENFPWRMTKDRRRQVSSSFVGVYIWKVCTWWTRVFIQSLGYRSDTMVMND